MNVRIILALYKLLQKETKVFPQQKYDLTTLELLHTDVLVHFLDIMNIAGPRPYTEATEDTELTDLSIPLHEYLSESAFEEDYPQEYRMYLNMLDNLENQIDQEAEMIYGNGIIYIVDSQEELDEWRKNVFPQYSTVG